MLYCQLSRVIAAPSIPAASWRLSHRVPLGSDLSQDSTGEEVSLLMAYALKLNRRRSLPVPEKDADKLRVSFFGAREGITYIVQTSSDMKAWTTEGVGLSDVLPGGQRTASVPLDGARCFLRLVVSE